jgi:hypothetical protein
VDATLNKLCVGFLLMVCSNLLNHHFVELFDVQQGASAVKKLLQHQQWSRYVEVVVNN